MGGFLNWYRQHVGTARSNVQLYVGLILFFVGAFGAIAGIAVYTAGADLIASRNARVELGGFTAALGLAVAFAGIELTLPSKKAIHIISGVGALVCIFAIAEFSQYYPENWSDRALDRDMSTTVVGHYLIGLIILATTTGIALVLNFLSRHMTLPGQEFDDIFTGREKDVSIEEVMRDIEREVARQKLTWGGEGFEKPLEGNVLKMGMGFDEGTYVSKGRAGKVTETIANEMDTAFTALSQIRGRDLKSQTSEDDTATALTALRALKRVRQVEAEASWWYRFKRAVVRLFTGDRTPTIPDEWKKPNEGKRGHGNAPAAAPAVVTPPPLAAKGGKGGEGRGPR